tara:strand:+ start:311 stop:637 length:327 start_codon:yes stop_codon:yes gene_type:complete
MYWDIKKEAHFNLYSPLNAIEMEFIQAINEIDVAENTMIDASKITLTTSVIDALIKCHQAHLNFKKSFVVVSSNIALKSNLHELFVVVPTISEAIDYIYMEELEKNFE